MSQPLIKIEGLYKLFGNKPKQHMELVHSGKTKDEILAETGHTLGLREIRASENTSASSKSYYLLWIAPSGHI